MSVLPAYSLLPSRVLYGNNSIAALLDGAYKYTKSSRVVDNRKEQLRLGKGYKFPSGYVSIQMTQKTIGRNTGRSGRVNLSGSELNKFDAEVGDAIKVDVAEAKGIAIAIIENRSESEFVIVSKPETDPSTTERTDE